MGRNKNIEHLKDEIIELYQSGLSCKSIGQKFGLSHNFIHTNLKKWEVELRTPKLVKESKYDNYKEEIHQLYFSEKLSVLKIADILSLKYKEAFDSSSIYASFKRWGWNAREFKEMAKVDIDENYFETIDSEEKAYWLGFIYADGYVTKGGYVGISLNVRDYEHLEKFKKAISSEHNINIYKTTTSYGYTEYARISFKSELMKKHLEDKGCIESKTLQLKFPSVEVLPKNFQKDFIRGYVDGDGSIILGKKYSFKLCGTLEFLKEVVRILKENIPNYDFKFSPYRRHKEDEKNNFAICYSGKFQTACIAKWLYDNSTIYLDRKYERYINLKAK